MPWVHLIKENVLKPAMRRMGTVGAAALVFGGDWMCKNLDACGLVTQTGAEMVMTYIAAVGMLAFDVAITMYQRHRERQRGERP